MLKRIFTLAGIAVFGSMTLSGCTDDMPMGQFLLPEATPGVVVQDEPEADAPAQATEPDAPAQATEPDAPAQIDEDAIILDGTAFERIREQPATMLQLTPLLPGEELATLHTTAGDITLRFFPGEAPLAVENFTTHARAGFYDGVIFHRVFPGFMVQSGCPLGTGTGGESIWGETFELEFSMNLRHFRGALAMAHAHGNMGSQFYIVQNPSLHPSFEGMFHEIIDYQDEFIGQFSDGGRIYLRDLHPANGAQHFLDNGGTPHLDWFWSEGVPHPVFGHVVSGMDVVDAIATAAADPHGMPDAPVIIERISFFYHE